MSTRTAPDLGHALTDLVETALLVVAVAAAVLVVALAGDWTGGSWRSG